MKKIEVRSLLALLLAAIMVFAMVACGGADDTLPVDDDTTDPVVTDPPATDPVETDPPATDPVVTDPPATDPVVTDPPATDPVVTDPPVTEPSEPTVTPPTVTGCTHGFGYNADVIAEVTDIGIVYKCKACGDAVVRAVTIGNGPKFTSDGYTIEVGSKQYIEELTPYNNVIFGTEITESAFITFDLNISEVAAIADGETKSMIIWRPSTGLTVTDGIVTGHGTAYTQHIIRLTNNAGKYFVWLGGNSGTQTTTEIELNKTHQFIIEFNAAETNAYIYMDGQYIGMISGQKLYNTNREYFTLQINSETASGTYSNFKFYKPEFDKIG